MIMEVRALKATIRLREIRVVVEDENIFIDVVFSQIRIPNFPT